MIKIGIIMPSTNRGISCKSYKDIPFYKIFLKYFVKSYNNTGKYNFKIYMVIDRDDPIYSNINEMSKIKKFISLIKFLDIEFIWSDNIEKGHVTAMWNRAFTYAYNDDCEYFYQAGDDVCIMDKGWEEYFISSLKKTDNFGISGPFDYGRFLYEKETGSKQKFILTQSFVSRVHYDIFGYYFNPEIKNWFCDDWITNLYLNIKLLYCDKKYRIQNMGGDPRYTPVGEGDQWRETTILCMRLVKEDTEKIRKYVNNLEKKNNNNIKTNMNKNDKSIKLFWQYPVITEKAFYEQNKQDPNYFGLPWATIIDKRIDLNEIYKFIIQTKINEGKPECYTCCQHISFRKLINFWKILGVKTVYSPHKVIGENEINGIKILPCPLYAVNIEDPSRNKLIKESNLLKCKRSIAYSFAGGYQPGNYLTDIRARIYKLKSRKKNDVHIVNTGDWHFNCVVYNNKQNSNGELNEDVRHKEKTYKYNELLLKSRFTLCPSGSGPNSIRFWESLGAGSIPVLLADTLELPENKLWESAIIRLPEKDIDKVDNLIRNITPEEENARREKCLSLYKFYKNNYRNEKMIIAHYCCGSYDQGAIGGVARYDYHIKLAFPNRIFIMQKDPNFVNFCEKYKDRLIVITDNHLACDVPNYVNTYLVHHGVAETHAEREPGWNEYWKNLCCEGQKKMLYYRDPKTTKIISIAEFCTDEFKRIYGSVYTKFNIQKILHTSELDESLFKKNFNNKACILGNWKGVNKGEIIVNKLKKICKAYNFNKLRVHIDDRGIDDFNKRKQNIYLENDIFLNLSLCEGFSYSALDALLCGLLVISTDVGVFYKDVPDDCFVKLEWDKINDINYVISKIEYGWKNKEKISKKGREWYMKNCRLIDWKKKMRQIIN